MECQGQKTQLEQHSAVYHQPYGHSKPSSETFKVEFLRYRALHTIFTIRAPTMAHLEMQLLLMTTMNIVIRRRQMVT